MIEELGALSEVIVGKGKGGVGTKLIAVFILYLVILSTVFGPKWPEVCRLTRHTERSYRVSIVAAFSISGMDFFEVELTLWEYTD